MLGKTRMYSLLGLWVDADMIHSHYRYWRVMFFMVVHAIGGGCPTGIQRQGRAKARMRCLEVDVVHDEVGRT